MSFGGVVGAMITSLKNNKRIRPSAFKKLKENNINHRTKAALHFDKKSSPEQLRSIRERITKENKTALQKQILSLSIILLILIFVIGFIKF